MPRFELSAESDGFIRDVMRKPSTMIVLLYIFKQSAKEKKTLPSEFAVVWEHYKDKGLRK